MASGAAWAYNLAPTIDAICPTSLHLLEGQALIDSAPDSAGPSRTPAPHQRVSNALAILKTDLEMATDVFSRTPFGSVGEPIASSSSAPKGLSADIRDATDMLSRASLKEKEPPRVQFGFLGPSSPPRRRSKKRKARPPDDGDGVDGNDNYDGQELGDDQQALGIRLLLSEWTIGEDPKEYVYVNPYINRGSKVSQPATHEYRMVSSVKDAPPPIVSQSHSQSRPPAVTGNFASQSTAPPLRPTTSSQNQPFLFDQFSLAWSQNQSQDAVWASTQPVTGAFGSRASIVAKTKAKKRMGGF